MEKITDLWNIRMRASKSAGCLKSKVKGLRSIHISGAEGIYNPPEIAKAIREYTLRAMNHSRGAPDNIVITIEKIKRKPFIIPLLPVSTVRCDSPDEAGRIIHKILASAGISEKAIKSGFRVVTGKISMRGASLILSDSGIRAEPDQHRGVRVSGLGIMKNTGESLSRRLAKEGINTKTVKEALVLASKVASCRGVAAELCISDDPDYTTGYVSARKLGYIRIPNIKYKGSAAGGRVFFINKESDVTHVIEYLEKTPAIVGKFSL